MTIFPLLKSFYLNCHDFFRISADFSMNELVPFSDLEVGCPSALNLGRELRYEFNVK